MEEKLVIRRTPLTSDLINRFAQSYNENLLSHEQALTIAYAAHYTAIIEFTKPLRGQYVSFENVYAKFIELVKSKIDLSTIRNTTP